MSRRSSRRYDPNALSELRCSFCGKRQSEVAKLIAGPTVYICNECVVLCMEIVDADTTASPTTEGQLLVCFPDGTVHTSEQQDAWRQLTYEGETMEWCRAMGFVRSPTAVPVLAVRRRGQHLIMGASFPPDAELTEVEARVVIEAFGGASRWSAEQRPTAKKRTNPFPFPGVRARFTFFTEDQNAMFLSQQYRVPTIDLDQYEVADEILQLVSKELCERHLVLPVSRAGNSLIVAMVDPKDEAASAQLKDVTGFKIEPVIATATAIRAAIARCFNRSE